MMLYPLTQNVEWDSADGPAVPLSTLSVFEPTKPARPDTAGRNRGQEQARSQGSGGYGIVQSERVQVGKVEHADVRRRPDWQDSGKGDDSGRLDKRRLGHRRPPKRSRPSRRALGRFYRRTY